MTRYSPVELADALGVHRPTDEQAAVIAAPPGPLVVIAGAGAGKTETMAARVVWLVANGYAEAGQVLGLTFTRKAAGQLLRRVRSRLARLAGAGLSVDGADPATVGTYHAFAGTLLREHGLLLPIEPDTRLLSPTELWQLAFEVVCGYPGELATDKSPAAITDLVLRLSGQLAEHLVGTTQLRDTHGELERLVHTLPPGPRQRDRGPGQYLLRLLDSQDERAELVPLIDALHARLRAEKAMDFGMQMAAAAQLADRHPRVGAALRERYRVVLLDEYQDTGHAQRIALSALFGGGVDDGLALTAVGDPIQSIYGWRGASATNLPRFCTDFPLADGSPAPTLELRTSWRNPPTTLHMANELSAGARRRAVAVGALRPRPGAEPGTVRCALLSDVVAERDWVADQLAARYRALGAGGPAPTAAVLVRRNADAAPMAEALRARGLPVEVVGLAGLLGIDEVADVVAMLRMAAEPTAGPAAVRVLTGPRWRLGAADLAALWRRARALADGPRAAAGSVAEVVAQTAPDADHPCLADAVCDPGPAAAYSGPGYARIRALADELTALRGCLEHPVSDLVAEVRRILGVDVEIRAAGRGSEQLDAFADIVDAWSHGGGHGAFGVHALLAYLEAAESVEDGLAPAGVVAEVGVADHRVQVLTVHAAKGLEWQIVAVPHLSGRVFPSTATARTWLTDAGELPPLLRGDRAAPGLQGVPVLDLSAATNRKQLSDSITGHRDELARRRLDEERRLLYVAVTRAEDTLLLSGHHWGATGLKPRGPSEFLLEVRDILERARAAGTPCGDVDQWAADPADGEQNPLRDNVIEAHWPVRSEAAAAGLRGAALVAAARSALAGGLTPDAGADPHGWSADVDALLAERAAAAAAPTAALPTALSVSGLVELGRDRSTALRRMHRRLPARPDADALLGTAFHEWVQRFYGSERLFDLDDLPGAVDGDVRRPEAERLAELQAAFAASSWAARTPLDVEVPFEMVLGEHIVRGRIDAVFADPDGGVTVVDWKTGSPPVDAESRRQAAVQLGVYRLAWAALQGCPLARVRTAFHYVRSGQTVIPDDLPDADTLLALLAA